MAVVHLGRDRGGAVIEVHGGVVDYDRDVRAIAHAASHIAQSEGWSRMTPELLLLAALHDEAVRQFWGGEVAKATTERLRVAIRLQGESPGADPVLGTDGWTLQAQLAVSRAMSRASGRGSIRPAGVAPVREDTAPPTGWTLRRAVRAVAQLRIRPGTWIARGDLLHGLATVPIVGAQEALVAMPRLYGGLDAEDPSVPAGDATGTAAPAGIGRASVVLDDDATSTMVAVTTLLVEVLGLTRDRAAVAMHRVHFRGADRVVTLPWGEAQDAVARCRARATELAPQLVIRLVPG